MCNLSEQKGFINNKIKKKNKEIIDFMLFCFQYLIFICSYNINFPAQNINFQDIKQDQFDFLLLQVIVLRYLDLFISMFSHKSPDSSVGQSFRLVSKRSCVQISLGTTGYFVIFPYMPFPSNSFFPNFPKEFSHFLSNIGSHS